MTPDAHSALVPRLLPASRLQSLPLALALVLLGTVILWASAKVQVPFWPVPATLQSLAVVLIGAFYGARLGGATLLAYLGEGAMGLPVFAGTPEKGLGLAYMMGPTGGYLLGFLLAAVLIGRLVETGVARSVALTALAVLASHAVIHALGLLWLGGAIGFAKAVSVAFVPFLPADLLKMALSTALILALARRPAR